MDYIVASIAGTARALWESAQERLLFLPPFPDQIDTLALFSLLLVVGLLAGEWLRARLGWPKMVGYVLAGIVFGPSALNWISAESLAHARPIADAALGLLLMEAGRRLDQHEMTGRAFVDGEIRRRVAQEEVGARARALATGSARRTACHGAGPVHRRAGRPAPAVGRGRAPA